MRQKRIHEMVSSSCNHCAFSDKHSGCASPGGTCVYRKVSGIPGHYVGDVLRNAGVIHEGWQQRQIEEENVQVTS